MSRSQLCSGAILDSDPLLKCYEPVLRRRWRHTREVENRLTGGRIDLADFASGHEYFGLHLRGDQWILREWAPNASGICLVGDMTGWQPRPEFAFDLIDTLQGVWQLRLPQDCLGHGDHYHLLVSWPGGQGPRIPAYARRVVQDPTTHIFSAQVWRPEPYRWRCAEFTAADRAPLIYETHVGMAQEEGSVGTYAEFTRRILPRIVKSGYNTLQLMAIPEHPYYASFGYHVANFFAPSSRFGTPEEFKALIDSAHTAGLAVIMDVVHSHAVLNELEGLSRFDGTPYQYFHAGHRGYHPAWGSRCFDYAKPQVLHFLLSNCRFWLDEYRVDGFRFDGVTSMLYHHHGLGTEFRLYEQYFGDDVDQDALAYLTLANKLIHTIRPDAVTIAEDVSGLPGLAFSQEGGGVGFDYRFAMGIADLWPQLIERKPDEHWSMGRIWAELTNRRPQERTISYAESHDQAIVGDQTLIMRLAGADIYRHMRIDGRTNRIDRALSLHKMIRLITLATAADGYLNFMGNEFGHPEWIDFPRQGNNWSYHYARRQWQLKDDPQLNYRFLDRFDREMIALAVAHGLLNAPELRLLYEHDVDKVLIFKRAGLLFGFNFHPSRSHVDYRFHAPPGTYRMILDSDDAVYGGHQRLLPRQLHHTMVMDIGGQGDTGLSLYLPNRTALVLKRIGPDPATRSTSSAG